MRVSLKSQPVLFVHTYNNNEDVLMKVTADFSFVYINNDAKRTCEICIQIICTSQTCTETLRETRYTPECSQN